MDLKAAIERLRSDEDYYGDFGKQFLSNSDISALLSDPTQFKKPTKKTSALVVGGYFHTAILEPDKLHRFKVIEASSRNTKAYKELSDGEICLLQHEADMIEVMKEKLLANDTCRGLIQGDHDDAKIEYEVPNIVELGGNLWKGKADIINHDERLIIDLKTTGDINQFSWSAKKYNYDSQAYIYSQMFGYEFLFIVIDKNTHQIGIFDCSPQFYEKGLAKVEEANLAYDLLQDENFKPENYFITKTL
jgi:hypothetical protein